MRQADLTREHPAGLGGEQLLWKFQNGYGASAVRSMFSYGGLDGKWELAVVRFEGEGLARFHIVYDTPVTDDVLGYLSEAEVDEALKQIEMLPPITCLPSSPGP
jgi:hypothetical protein